MELAHATIIAKTIKAQLEYFCEEGMCNIAGSVRREKPDVKDIELVVVPKKQAQGQVAMFEEVPNSIIQAPCKEFIVTANSIGKIIKGTPQGKYMQIELRELINLDLFIANKINYGNIMLIRTGDWEFSKLFMGTVLRKNGYYSEDGYVKKNNIVIPTPTEKTLFDICNLSYIEPKDRNLKTLEDIL